MTPSGTEPEVPKPFEVPEIPDLPQPDSVSDDDYAFYKAATKALGDLARMQGARLDAVDELTDKIGELNRSLGQVNTKLSTLATYETLEVRLFELERTLKFARRRALTRVLLACLWFGLLLGAVVDNHTESCGPGARSEQVIQRFLEPNATEEALREAAMQRRPWHCDLSIPWHTHDPGPWPTRANVYGILAYASVGIGTLVTVHYTRKPR